jgi:hypothetical protein
VEKENQHLLSKMARIMRSVPFNESREFLPGIRLNPGNEPRMDMQIAQVTYSRGAASYTVKRNQAFVSRLQREQHLKRISDENLVRAQRQHRHREARAAGGPGACGSGRAWLWQPKPLSAPRFKEA